MAGDGDTPLAGAYAPADLATVGGLSVARYAYDLADWENCLWAIPLGASGHPASPHYADQSETWRQVQMVPMQYAWPRHHRQLPSPANPSAGLGEWSAFMPKANGTARQRGRLRRRPIPVRLAQ